MTDHCPTCGAAVRIEASGVTHYMVPIDAERVRELEERIRELEALLAEAHADATRWRWLIQSAHLGFRGGPPWDAVISLPVLDFDAHDIAALVDAGIREDNMEPPR